MTQYQTRRYHAPGLPGHIFTPAESPGREPESMVLPYTLQTLTLTLAGAPDPLIADATFSVSFPAPWGGSVTVSYDATAGQALSDVAAGLQAAWVSVANPASTLYGASTVGLVTTIVAKSYEIQNAAALFTTSTPGGYTITVAQTQAAARGQILMGLFCRYGTVPVVGTVLSPPRVRVAAPLVLATTIDQIRGVVAREANSVEQGWPPDPANPDAYPAGPHPFPVLKRGEIATIVDPASPANGLVLDAAVYVVRNAGAYTIPGAVASAADGANTLRLDNTTPVRARVTIPEWTYSLGAYSVRLVGLTVNQTN